MLPFDDILSIAEALQSDNSDAIVNERLTDIPVESGVRNEPIYNVAGFTNEALNELGDQPSQAGTQTETDSELSKIGNRLDSILDVQNQQLSALRNRSNVSSAEGIGTISNSTNNNATASISNDSSLIQVSNFVNELQTLESSIEALNTRVENNNVSNATRNSSAIINQGDISVERNFESNTNEPTGTGLAQFSSFNPRDREILSQFVTFTTTQNNSAVTNNGGQTSAQSSTNSESNNQNFSVNNSALMNAIQEIHDGDMTIDRTEIDNRVNQTSNVNSNETKVQNAGLITAFSTALAQHDQTLIQTINQTVNVPSKKQEAVIQTLASNNETQTAPGVQNNAQTVDNSNQEIVSLLSQISMQLMQLNAAMSRKTSFA